MSAPAIVGHLLVTNDFPPKHGGIQSYLWELWRRLPVGDATVLTTSYQEAASFDAEQPFPTERADTKVLLPTRALRRRIDELADRVDARLVVLDPALPLGRIGPSLRHPYAVVIHGAEVTVPGRLPLTRRQLARVLRGARLVVSAGGYAAAEATRAAGGPSAMPPVAIVPPGVDTDRFRPLEPSERAAARERFGLPADALVVLGVSRLVPRKGFDTVLRAAAAVHERRPETVVAIAGGGRDRGRLERVARRSGAPARFLGRVSDEDLPQLYGCADVFAMCCRGNRWFGLEQEGFGIVFLEAAACAIPSIAGRSGGAHEAVVDGVTGVIVDRPRDVEAVAAAITRLLDDESLRRRLGAEARRRADTELTYDVIAPRLADALKAAEV